MTKAKVNRPRQNGRKQQGAARRSVATASVIPQIRSNIMVHHRFRFQASAAIDEDIGSVAILGALGTIATATNSKVTPINETFRIKRIEVWAPPSSVNGGATCSINWIGSTAYAPNLEVSETSVSTTFPAHLVATPPLDSLAAFWQSASGGSTLFHLVAPIGSIVDLVVDFLVGDDEDVFTITVATAILNNTYFLAFDGPTNNKLVPVSLQTTH